MLNTNSHVLLKPQTVWSQNRLREKAETDQMSDTATFGTWPFFRYLNTFQSVPKNGDADVRYSIKGPVLASFDTFRVLKCGELRSPTVFSAHWLTVPYSLILFNFAASLCQSHRCFKRRQGPITALCNVAETGTCTHIYTQIPPTPPFLWTRGFSTAG